MVSSFHPHSASEHPLKIAHDSRSGKAQLPPGFLESIWCEAWDLVTHHLGEAHCLQVLGLLVCSRGGGFHVIFQGLPCHVDESVSHGG